jgi:dGTPase
MREIDLDLSHHASAEAQCAAIADDIAYVAHDIDDGVRARLLSLDVIETMPLAGPILAGLKARYPRLDRERLVAELVRRVITGLVEDVIATARVQLAAVRPASAEGVRRAGAPVVTFSPAMAAAVDGAKAILFTEVYRAADVGRVMGAAEAVVTDLFELYRLVPGELPADWRRDLDLADRARVARRVCDYLAGMTDRFALQEFDRLFPGKLVNLGGLFDASVELG